MTPKISIVMSAYNAEQHLADTLDSLLAQTFTAFELIIANDGSTDSTGAIIDRYCQRDSRCRGVHLQQNTYIVGALNAGLALARAAVIVRADADDINVPERLAVLWDHHCRYPHLGVIGSFMRTLEVKTLLSNPCDHAAIGCRLIFDSALAQPTVLLNTAVTGPLHYREGVIDDWELWVRLYRQGVPMQNLAQPLVHYRTAAGSASRTLSQRRTAAYQQVDTEIACDLGYDPRPDISAYLRQPQPKGQFSLRDMRRWLSAVYLGARKSGRFSTAHLRQEVWRRWQSVLARPMLYREPFQLLNNTMLLRYTLTK